MYHRAVTGTDEYEGETRIGPDGIVKELAQLDALMFGRRLSTEEAGKWRCRTQALPIHFFISSLQLIYVVEFLRPRCNGMAPATLRLTSSDAGLDCGGFSS